MCYLVNQAADISWTAFKLSNFKLTYRLSHPESLGLEKSSPALVTSSLSPDFQPLLSTKHSCKGCKKSLWVTLMCLWDQSFVWGHTEKKIGVILTSGHYKIQDMLAGKRLVNLEYFLEGN